MLGSYATSYETMSSAEVDVALAEVVPFVDGMLGNLSLFPTSFGVSWACWLAWIMSSYGVSFLCFTSVLLLCSLTLLGAARRFSALLCPQLSGRLLTFTGHQGLPHCCFSILRCHQEEYAEAGRTGGQGFGPSATQEIVPLRGSHLGPHHGGRM
jgi:hypothetical protein